MSHSVSPPGPQREPQPDLSVVHYDTDTLDIVTGCGEKLLELSGGDSYSTDPAAVDCPRCTATLVDGQLAEPEPRLVVVASPAPGFPKQLAEVKADKGGRNVEVIYTESRTWANVSRKRITPVLACRLKIGGAEAHNAHAWYGHFDADKESGYWWCLGVEAPVDPITPEVYGEHFPERDERGTPVEPLRHSAEVGDVFTRCGVRVSQVERWTDDPATPVDCEPCRAALRRAFGTAFFADALDAEIPRFERRAVERLAELVDEEPGPAECRCRPSDQDPCDDCPHPLAYRETAPAAVDPVENPAELAPPIGPVPPPAEHRTVSLEVLTDDLRWAENARRRDDAFEASKLRVDGELEKADLLPAAARVGIVLRLDGEAVSVPETDAMWLAGFRQPPDVLEALLRQARHYADDHDGAELLMPTPDVLAALAGQPVGGFTATVQSRWGLVQPGWLVLVETMVADERDSVWLLVEDRTECPDEGCLVAQGSPWSCAVTTVRGQGFQHRNAFHACSVRIPADQPAPQVTR